MKLILALFALLSFSSFAKEDPVVRCTLNLRPTGIWYNQCPPRMLADGVDVVGHPPFPNVRVRCVAPEIICTNAKKDLQERIN